MTKRAIFPGTFEIFHKGHEHILLKAKKIFDEIFVVVANNPSKSSSPIFDRYKRVSEQLEKLNLDGVYVKMCETKLSDIGKMYDICFIIRGVRNKKDFLYEKNLLKEYKKDYINFEVVFFICDEDMESFSSSNILNN